MSRRCLVLCAFFGIFLSLCTAAFAEKNPFIHNGTLNYFPESAAHPLGANGAWLANHFDVIIGMSEPRYAQLRADIVAANPKTRILQYIQLQQVTKTLTDPLYQRILKQPDPEVYFFNAVTRCIQKTGLSNQTRIAGQRICTDYGAQCYPDDRDGSRWLIDITSAANRQFLVDWVRDFFANRSRNLHGFMVDNNSAGGAGTQLISGIMQREAGNVTAPFNILAWGSAYEEYMNYLMRTLDSQLDPAIPVVSNYGPYDLTGCSIWGWPSDPNGCMRSLNGITFTYPMAKRLAYERGLLTEFKIYFKNTYPNVDKANTPLKEVWQARGAPSNTIYFQYYQSSGVAGIVPDSDDRIKIWSLASHLLYQFDGLFYHYHSHNNASPDTDWFDAQDARIGSAAGEKTSIDDRTFKRVYSNGVVLVRFRTSDSDNYTDSQSYDLDGTYYPVVHANNEGAGIYGPPVTRVTLRNQEGFIGIKNPAGPPVVPNTFPK